jgi:hypothetical protein
VFGSSTIRARLIVPAGRPTQDRGGEKYSRRATKLTIARIHIATPKDKSSAEVKIRKYTHRYFR